LSLDPVQAVQTGMSPEALAQLSEKVRRVFTDLAIDKRRLPASQLQKRGIPAYVGEWLLDTIVPGDGPLTSAEAERVQSWASRYIPSPNDANLLKNRLIDGEILKVLTVVQVDVVLTRKRQEKVAKMSLLGIGDAYIADTLVQQYPDLLNQGMWGVVELLNTQDGVTISHFRPMQASVNLRLYKEARHEFTLAEWQALMLTSMGYNPCAFTQEEQLWLLCRLLPLVQKNMHMMELAPKGTGKSYVYENISPRVRLVSGGNISPAVLFVNNASGQWGLLARYAVLVLDEVQTLKFEKPEEIVGGLKGFLANGRLTRGGLHETASDCGLVMLANIALDNEQRPIKEFLVSELPPFLQETAFLDRLRAIVPGWRIRKLSGECFAQSVGLKSDFFGDALLALRDDLEFDQRCAQRIQLKGEKIYKRNEDAVRSMASGLMKILFPHGELTDREFRHYCLEPAKALRQRVWSEMQILDGEYRQYESEIYYDLLPG
jgi:ATP-dependent Lon protease